MTIGRKISFACAALVAITIALGIISILNVGRIERAGKSVVTDSLPGLLSSARLDGLIKEMRAVMLRHIAADSAVIKIQAESSLAEAQTRFQAELRVYETTIHRARDRELFAEVAPAYQRFMRACAGIQPVSREMKTREALGIWMAEGFPAAAAVEKSIEKMLEDNEDSVKASAAATAAAAGSARLWSLLILGFAAASGVLLACLMTWDINRTLTHGLTQLGEAAERVSIASGQVASASQSLAQGASQQAASLEETSASSEEMAAMTRKNAENAQHAAEFMGAMSERVADANRTLDEMMTSMKEIGASSGKISKIIKVIDEIAFQTNILALNAAVEAARAGEAGMGFAVVAGEVRNLAQRSAQAARDTAALIEESIRKSGEGGRKLGQVAGSIQAITEGADRVKTLIDEVDASSREQAQGIEQISGTVAGMDRVTQTAAVSARQSAAASAELTQQSDALIAVVARLRVVVGGRPERSAVRPAPAARRPDKRRVEEFPLDDSEFREF